MKKELVWINFTKGICLLLVYLYHSEFYSGVSTTWLKALYYPFFTNLFFIISGYLLFKKHLSTIEHQHVNQVDYLKNILLRIIIPSIIFSSLIFFPKQIIRSEEIEINEFLFETIGGGAMWFTSALAIAQLLFIIPLQIRVKNTIYYIFYGILLTIIATHLTSNGCELSFYHFRSGMIATLFLSIGGLYYKHEERITEISVRKSTLLINAILLIIYIYVVTQTSWAASSTAYGMVNIIGVFCTIYISLNIILLSKKLPNISFISYIGKNSILFYFLSGAIPNVIAILTKHIVPRNVLGVFIVCLTSITIASIAVYLIKLHCPWLIDLRNRSGTLKR